MEHYFYFPVSSGNQRNGTCFTSTECDDRGGSSNGGCASGFGVCCVFTVSDASSVHENCTYVQNPSFPASDTASTARLILKNHY